MYDTTIPRTPEESKICVHGNEVWYGHECGICDDAGFYEWAEQVEWAAVWKYTIDDFAVMHRFGPDRHGAEKWVKSYIDDPRYHENQDAHIEFRVITPWMRKCD